MYTGRYTVYGIIVWFLDMAKRKGYGIFTKIRLSQELEDEMRRIERRELE